MSVQPTQGANDVRPGGFESSGANGGADGKTGGKGNGIVSAGFDGGGGSGPGVGGWSKDSGGKGRGVAASGFGDYQSAASPATIAKATSQVTPVEISFKPKPAYTPEAKRRGIEGEVQLEVNFAANGQITVLRIVRGLDSGLDESARSAAQQIRFRPATRDGVPVDVRGIVHIVFELS